MPSDFLLLFLQREIMLVNVFMSFVLNFKMAEKVGDVIGTFANSPNVASFTERHPPLRVPLEKIPDNVRPRTWNTIRLVFLNFGNRQVERAKSVESKETGISLHSAVFVFFRVKFFESFGMNRRFGPEMRY